MFLGSSDDEGRLVRITEIEEGEGHNLPRMEDYVLLIISRCLSFGGNSD